MIIATIEHGKSMYICN